MSVVNFAVFVVVAKCYKYKTDTEDSQDCLLPAYDSIPPGNPRTNSPHVGMVNPVYLQETNWQLKAKVIQ